MASDVVELVVLGVAQDGGVPQAGCSCSRCLAAINDPVLRRFPVSCAIRGLDGGLHLIEATRDLSAQLGMLSSALGLDSIPIPETICLTHAHLGHIDGLGQFGKEVMGADSVPLYASESVLEEIVRKGLAQPFELREITSNVSFKPSKGCGFEYSLIPVPHRDDVSETHAVLIRGAVASVLFLPDHDDWRETLDRHGKSNIREWLSELDVDVALLDGTFWDSSELPGRDMSMIPHPPITETLDRLGVRIQGDPEIRFTHINHSNPVLDIASPEAIEIESMGWSLARQAEVIFL